MNKEKVSNDRPNKQQKHCSNEVKPTSTYAQKRPNKPIDSQKQMPIEFTISNRSLRIVFLNNPRRLLPFLQNVEQLEFDEQNT